MGKGRELTAKSDDELVQAAMGGEVACFVALCHRYYASLVAVARAVLGDAHLAEDAAQEALATACRQLRTLKTPARFGPWVTTICRNEAHDILRRRPAVERLGERDIPAASPTPDSDDDAVRQALESLPAEARELLHLRYHGELSYEAIAAQLDITVEAVHGRLRRAKQDVKSHVLRTRARDRRSS